MQHLVEVSNEMSQWRLLQLDTPCGQLAESSGFQLQTQEIKQHLQAWEKELIMLPFARRLMLRM